MSGTRARASTARVRVSLAGYTFTQVIRVTIARDLQNIAGTFEIVLLDDVRLYRALQAYVGDRQQGAPETAPGLAVNLAIDNEVVLVGWIDKALLRWSADTIECHLTGRDKTGDLVDCAALPNGPAEFRGVDLLHVAKKVAEPFGITVKAEVDIGGPFAQLSLHPHQTALAFLESAARQRAVLLVSDGVGGMLLTRGGATRAPGPLRLGENVVEITAGFDWTQRFSDYFVKQQSARTGTATPARLDHSIAPAATTDAGSYGPASKAEAKQIIATGHAIDPEVKRWRPTVRLTRTQSGMTTVQEQAEWMLRVARGHSDIIHIRVLDWRSGDKNELWRPNTLATVYDPYSGLDKEMLIAGIAYRFDDGGYRTELRVVGRTAYDRINEAERRHGHHHRGHRDAKLDSSPAPLVAGEGRR